MKYNSIVEGSDNKGYVEVSKNAELQLCQVFVIYIFHLQQADFILNSCEICTFAFSSLCLQSL